MIWLAIAIYALGGTILYLSAKQDGEDTAAAAWFAILWPALVAWFAVVVVTDEVRKLLTRSGEE